MKNEIRRITAAVLSLAIVGGAVPAFINTDDIGTNLTAYAAYEHTVSDVIEGRLSENDLVSSLRNDTSETWYCAYDSDSRLIICSKPIIADAYSNHYEIKSGDTLKLECDFKKYQYIDGRLKGDSFYCTNTIIPEGFISYIPQNIKKLYFTQAEELQDRSLANVKNNELEIFFSQSLSYIDSYAFENSEFKSVYFKDCEPGISGKAFLYISRINFYYPNNNQFWEDTFRYCDFANSNILLNVYDMNDCIIKDGSDEWITGDSYFYGTIRNTTNYDINLIDLGDRALLAYDRYIVEKYKDIAVELPKDTEISLDEYSFSEVFFLEGSVDGDIFYCGAPIPEVFEFLPSKAKAISFSSTDILQINDYSMAYQNYPALDLYFDGWNNLRYNFGSYVLKGSDFNNIYFDTKYIPDAVPESFVGAGDMNIYFTDENVGWEGFAFEHSKDNKIRWNPDFPVENQKIEAIGESASIDKNINMQLYLDIPQEFEDRAKILVSVNGEEPYEASADHFEDSVFTVSVNGISAKDAANPIVLWVVDRNDPDNILCDKIYTSARDYLVALFKESNNYQNRYPYYTSNLASAMLNYCDAAEKFFDLDTTADMNLEEVWTYEGVPVYEILHSVKIQSASQKPENTPKGWHYEGASLLLKSKITLREYFTVDASTDVSVFDGHKGNMYYIEKTDINPNEMATADLYGYTVYSYISAVLNNRNADEKLVTLCAALFNYAECAEEYYSLNN